MNAEPRTEFLTVRNTVRERILEIAAQVVVGLHRHDVRAVGEQHHIVGDLQVMGACVDAGGEEPDRPQPPRIGGVENRHTVAEHVADVDVTAVDHHLHAVRPSALIAVRQMTNAPADAYAVSLPFLKLCGFALGGWQLAKSAAIAERKLAEGGADKQFFAGKIASARFYADHILPQTLALARVVAKGSGSVVETDAELI